MVLLTKATNGIATQAEGSFTNCGAGTDDFELSYSCQGPACSSLDGSFLDIACHKDGNTRLICSNSSKCQSGASSYQSNFTFSQNEPDPWSPAMENEPDTWVAQQQHVLVAECARFSVSSDGTRQGTRVDDESLSGSCPNIEKWPVAKESAEQELISTGRPRAAATQTPLVVAGTNSRGTVSTTNMLLAFMFAWLLLLPGTFAASTHHRHRDSSQDFDVNARTTSDNLKAFAETFRTKLAQQAGIKSIDGEALADKVVATVVLSVCASHFEGSVPSPFTSELVKQCVSSVYDDATLSQAGVKFLVIFGASLLCDYIISEVYPYGQSLVTDRCDGLRDLVHEVRTTSRVTIPSASTVPLTSNSNTDGPGTRPDQRLDFVGQLSQTSIFSSIRTSPSSSKMTSTMESTSPYSFETGGPQSAIMVLLMDNLLPSDISSVASLPETLSLAMLSGVTTPLTHSLAASVNKLPSGLSTLKVSPAVLVQTAVPGVETPTRGITMPDSFEFGSAATASADPMPANSLISIAIHSVERHPNSLSSATVSVVMLHSGHSSLVDSALSLAAVDTVALRLPAHYSSEIAQISKQKVQAPEPTGLAIIVATAQASFRSSNEPLTSTFSSADSVDQVSTSAEDDSSVSTPNGELSTGRVLTAKTSTLNEITEPAGSHAKLTMSHSAAQTDVVTIVFGTKSWSGLSPTGSSQASLATKTSQSNATPLLDDEHWVSLVTATGRSHFHQSYHLNSSAPVLEPWTFADTSSTDSTWDTSAPGSTALILSTSTINPSTFLTSVSRANATRASSLPTTLPSYSTSWQPSMSSIKNFDFNVTPSVKISTASSASGPVSRPLISSEGGTGLMTDQATAVEQIVVTTLQMVTGHFDPVIMSVSTSSSYDRNLVISCFQDIMKPDFCPGSGCVNLMTDKAHCGACGQVCKHSCRQGACTCPDSTRPYGDSECLHKPGSSACSVGFTRDDVKVCAPVQMTRPTVSSKPAKTQPPDTTIPVAPFALPPSREPKGTTASETTFRTQLPAIKPLRCPSNLPNMCNGSCFNTKTESYHCGGCGNYCSGTCIDRQCLATSTPSRQRLVSVWRTITVTKVLPALSVSESVSSTPPQVASYIWKGVAGF